MIRLIQEILTDGSAVWNIKFEETEIPCIDKAHAMKLGNTMAECIPGGVFDTDYVKRWA